MLIITLLAQDPFDPLPADNPTLYQPPPPETISSGSEPEEDLNTNSLNSKVQANGRNRNILDIDALFVAPPSEDIV